MLRGIASKLVFGAVGALAWSACAGESDSPETGDGSITTGVSASATAGSQQASTGAWGAGHQGGGGEGAGSTGPYPIVFTPAVDPFNDSTFRGGQLAAHIETILAETGYDKVVIIGHSQGGLDARVVAHDRPDLVAAVVTVATPHGGTPVADVALGLLDDPNFAGIVDDLVNAIGAPLYDQVGNETAVSKPMHLFSSPGIAAFNAAYPDAPGVFYASITGRTDHSLGGVACVPDVKPAFMTTNESDDDPTDPFFFLTETLIDGDGSIPNDGLVRVVDARHGEFWGCIPADHLDEVGHLLGDGPGFGNDFHHHEFYRDLVAHLRSLGY